MQPSRAESPSQNGALSDAGRRQWATWADWAEPPRKANRWECLADIGCPPSSSQIPPCSDNLTAVTIRELESWQDAGSAPADVLVRGRLRSSSTMLSTLLLCHRSDGKRACCNGTSAGLVLEDDGRQVLLTERNDPYAFRCTGDDSRQCCGFAGIPGILVIVKGRAAESTAAITGVRLELTDVHICAMQGT